MEDIKDFFCRFEHLFLKVKKVLLFLMVIGAVISMSLGIFYSLNKQNSIYFNVFIAACFGIVGFWLLLFVEVLELEEY